MKALRFLGVAILACSMLFVSCKKDKQFTITVNSNNAEWGTVTGGGQYAQNATATLTATAKEGYKFVKWQDGNTTNPRTITVTKDETYTATFEKGGTPGPDPQPGSTTITFNGGSWTAFNVGAVDHSAQDYMTYVINKSADSETGADVYLEGFLENTPGTYTYAETYDCFNYYDPNYIVTIDEETAAMFGVDPGEYLGWNYDEESFVENIVAFDLNAKTTTATFTEDIWDLANLIASGGTSYGEMKQLAGNMDNAPWTLLESKANTMRKGHKAPKFVKVR